MSATQHTTREVVNWRACAHHFVFYFGPTKTCMHCGAMTIASVGGESKPIFPPTQEKEYPIEGATAE